MNLAFVREHCRTEAHVKALICHEFLHVLLRHTERLTTLTRAEHLAVDAVINAIIHRSLGPEYSGMMSRYYADERGVARLLRPPTDDEQGRTNRVFCRRLRTRREETRVLSAWAGLYGGRLVADDIRDLARDLVEADDRPIAPLLGNHDDLPARDILARHVDGTVGGRAGHGTQGHERLGRVPQPEGAGSGCRRLSQ